MLSKSSSFLLNFICLDNIFLNPSTRNQQKIDFFGGKSFQVVFFLGILTQIWYFRRNKNDCIKEIMNIFIINGVYSPDKKNTRADAIFGMKWTAELILSKYAIPIICYPYLGLMKFQPWKETGLPPSKYIIYVNKYVGRLSK